MIGLSMLNVGLRNRRAGEKEFADNDDAVVIGDSRNAGIGERGDAGRNGRGSPVVVLDPLIGIAAVTADPCRVLRMHTGDAQRRGREQRRQQLMRNGPQTVPSITVAVLL